VGRPSTYAAIIETLNSREYTTREKRQLMPTELGLKVNDLLVAKLDSLFNVGFTAAMEEELDHVEEGRTEWTKMMGDFYQRFSDWMEQAKEPPADLAKVEGVMALVSQIKEWGPEVQRGKRKYSDARFVTSIIEQIEEKEKPITDKQVEALVKIAMRYRSQIPDLDAQLTKLGYQELVVSDQAMATTESSMVRFDHLSKIKLSESQMGFVDSLRSQMDNGRKLSDKQMAALERIIVQNASQFENFDEVRTQLGLSGEHAKPEQDNESPLLLEMLGQVTEWQEPVKRGKMVFNDKDFYDSLSGQFARQQSLTFRQRAAMRRLVFRYKSQIPKFEEYAERLGLNKKADKKDE
jgi:nitrous oxide reductase accessory protein NosL